MALRPLSDVSAADWFAGGEGHRLGPPGFAAHARVLHPFMEVAAGEPSDRVEGYLPDDELTALRHVLARHTGSDAACFFALWDGYGDIYGGESTAFLTAFAGSVPWPGRLFRPERPKDPPPAAFPPEVLAGPRIHRGDRDYFLFGGHLRHAGKWGAAGYGHGIPRDLNSPNLIWPADHAWFVTTDIEGSWTAVAGTESLIEDLLQEPRLEVVRARYDDPKVSQ